MLKPQLKKKYGLASDYGWVSKGQLPEDLVEALAKAQEEQDQVAAHNSAVASGSDGRGWSPGYPTSDELSHGC